MLTGQFMHMRIVCPHCGAANRLTVDAGIGDFPIDCSHCHRTIGRMRDLERVPLPEGSVEPAGRAADYAGPTDRRTSESSLRIPAADPAPTTTGK